MVCIFSFFLQLFCSFVEIAYVHSSSRMGWLYRQTKKEAKVYKRRAHTTDTHTQNGGTILRRRVTKSKGAITQQMRGEKKLGINRTERKRETGRERWFNEHTWWHRQPDEKPFFFMGTNMCISQSRSGKLLNSLLKRTREKNLNRARNNNKIMKN